MTVKGYNNLTICWNVLRAKALDNQQDGDRATPNDYTSKATLFLSNITATQPRKKILRHGCSFAANLRGTRGKAALYELGRSETVRISVVII